MIIHIVVSEHIARGHLRGVEAASTEDARRRVHHGWPGGIETITGVVHGGRESERRSERKMGINWVVGGFPGGSIVLCKGEAKDLGRGGA